MLRSHFQNYIDRFNVEDPTAFDDYLHHDVQVLNGTILLDGVAEMKGHYVEHIWPHFVERLNPIRFISDDHIAAAELRTNFTAKHDAADTLFGPIKTGDQFDYHGIIMYDIRVGKFSSITVSYNSFRKTAADGTITELGIVH